MTRSDVHIGDNRNFNQTHMDLEQLTELGDDGADGPATVFNLQTLIEMQRQNLARNQVLDPEFAIPSRRLNFIFGAPFLVLGQVLLSTDNNVTYTGLVSSVFANGITIKLKLCTIATYHPQHRNYAAGHQANATAIGIFSQFFLRVKYPRWFTKYNYIVAGALDGGTQVISFILNLAVFGAVGNAHSFPEWWGNDLNYSADRCALPD
ncbi:hypothetical protein B0H13DRAFT_2317993 [Mycena leptocephala]|nr:hypothetical protein B0H13DRAFT_2317993 [Mycena leptocephala]